MEDMFLGLVVFHFFRFFLGDHLSMDRYVAVTESWPFYKDDFVYKQKLLQSSYKLNCTL